MAKRGRKPQTQRNRALVDFYETSTELSLREIGREFGVSPQRVCQLVREEEKRLGHEIVRGEPNAG